MNIAGAGVAGALFGLVARRKQDGSIVAVQCPVDGQVREAALLVDRIVGVLRLSPAEATLVRDAGSSGPGADFAVGVAAAGSEKVVLLDECRLLSSGSVRGHLA